MQQAEERIDQMVKDLQEIEEDLSLVIHRARQQARADPSGGANLPLLSFPWGLA